MGNFTYHVDQIKMVSLPHRAAIAVTSYNGPFYPDGKNTGAFYSEVLHPFKEFKKAGFDVDIVSETGSFGWDEHSIEPAFASEAELQESKEGPFADAVKSVKKPSDVSSSDYGIFFAAGGHGTIFDFEDKDVGLYKLAGNVWDQGGIVAAVCHGPVLLNGIKDKSGEYIAKSKNLTGFPDSGEVAMGLTGLLDSKGWLYTSSPLKKLGNYIAPEQPFDAKVVTDGRLVTGANPASATPTASAALKAFEALA